MCGGQMHNGKGKGTTDQCLHLLNTIEGASTHRARTARFSPLSRVGLLHHFFR